MKKEIRLIVLALAFSSAISAQIINYSCDSKEIQNLKTATLYIYPTGDKVFDDSLKSAVDKYWKQCPTKSLTIAEVPKYINDEKNYFIAPTMLSGTGSGSKMFLDSPIKDEKTNTLAIIFGGNYKNKSIVNYKDPLCVRKLIFYGKQNGAACLSFAVKNLNDNIELVINKQIKPIYTSAGTTRNPLIRQGLSEKANVLKNKTLLIDKDVVGSLLKEKIFKKYKYSYKILPSSEIIALLNSPDAKNYCVLSDDAAFSITLDIFDGETKSIIYSGKCVHAMAICLKDDDIEDLNECIEGRCK